MKKYVTLIFAAFITFAVSAWPTEKEVPFKDGEELFYHVSYRAALVPNTVVAEVKTITKAVDGEHGPEYHVLGNAQIMSFFRWFFDMNDTYEVWLDQKTLLPHRFANDLKEGRYLFKSWYTYDWDKMSVRTVSSRQKWDEDRIVDIPLTRESMDPLSMFYNMRSEDIGAYEKDVDIPLQLVFAKKIRNINFRFLGRETLNLKKVGKYKALKFSCELVNDDGQSFEDGTEFYVWISDDENKIPLYLESPVKVGSVKATIQKMKNLKYPMTSKIK